MDASERRRFRERKVVDGVDGRRTRADMVSVCACIKRNKRRSKEGRRERERENMCGWE